MPIIYDLIFLVIAAIYLPVYLFKGKFHKGFLSRLGYLPKGLRLRQPIWIHAVSVGEAIAVKGLIEAIRKDFPGRQLVISTVTPTGNKVIKDFAQDNDFLTYLPLDFSFITGKVIDAIYPSLVVIAETELWPNFILSLHKRGIPVLVVNARISDKSFKGYRRIKFLFKPVLDKVSLFCVQSSRDADRLKAIGAKEEKIRITGNMKFDIDDHADVKRDYTGHRLKLGLGLQEKLFVAGSTHPGEEEAILSAYKNLLRKFPFLKLLIAPRHPQRSGDIVRLVIKYGFTPFRISQLDAAAMPAKEAVFILDSVGQLKPFYSIADIVFVGGSLVKKGGHNIIEPASFFKPVICGPHMFNFRDIIELFLANAACIQINNPVELEQEIAGLLDNPQRIEGLAKKAKELIRENRGATLKNLQCVKESLKC